ncbi:MAG: hypothetical protein ACI87E_000826 [Mariniblastus sp.]|jgi:hypothetical protein
MDPRHDDRRRTRSTGYFLGIIAGRIEVALRNRERATELGAKDDQAPAQPM